MNDFDANSGDENTCNTTNNWDDTGTTGCTYSCSSAFVIINISLNTGWNLISIPLILEDNLVANVFGGINYSQIFSYDSGWNIPIKINNTLGYWIKADNDYTLTVEGLEENTTINLNNGWNLVGYPSVDGINIDESDLKNYAVFTYNNLWSSYIPGRAFNSLQTLMPGYGYWVKAD